MNFWKGYIVLVTFRMDNYGIPNKVLNGKFFGRRPVGRPRMSATLFTTNPTGLQLTARITRISANFMFVVPCIMNVIFVSFQRDAAASSLYFISLQNLSTCFGCSLHPSSGVLKTAYATTGTTYLPHHMTCTSGCICSFKYSWWWVQRPPETCREILQWNKTKPQTAASRWKLTNISVFRHLGAVIKPVQTHSWVN
jgi:hypothetical protein